MKKSIVIVVILLFLAGNIYQALNPRVITTIEIKEVEKIVTKIEKDIRVVKVTAPDGTITETTEDRSRSEIDRDVFSSNSNKTEPLPLPLNGTYLAVNPARTTDLQLIQTRKIFGALEVVGTAGADLSTINFGGEENVKMDYAFRIGLGIKY